MVKNIVLLLLYIIMTNKYLFARIKLEKPETLFEILIDNDGWEVINVENNITISTKSLNNSTLGAFMVQQKTTIPPKVIQEIIMDVNNYNIYFNNPGLSNFKELDRSISWVDGYHFIQVAIPFIKDREYYFRIHRDGYSINDTSSIVHWYLLNEIDSSYKKINMKINNTITIHQGAGIWTAQDFVGDSYILSYRLFLDPGGFIPAFAKDIMNETNIVNIFKNVLTEAKIRNTNLFH